MHIKGLVKPTVLIILDGWGIAPAWGGNAISEARPKNFDMLWQNYPKCLLAASGKDVGLPSNSPGNSEAGHLNIGAGHIVEQDAGLINSQINDGSFFQNRAILEAIEHAENNNSNIHLIGLLSKTGTHSDISHLYALLEFMKEKSFSRVYIHLFSDGRDSPPMSGIELGEELANKLAEFGVGTVASLSGRFFAMDRDNRWGRIARAYNMLVKSEGNKFDSLRSAFSSAYAMGMTDEFIEPRIISNLNQPITPIQNNDSVIFFNFRSDRTKELTKAFLAEQLPEFPDRKKLNNLFFATFVIYQGESLAKQVFKPKVISMPLSKSFSDIGLKQFHIAETEKYPHVTYFINGGNENPFPGEDRFLVPSPKKVKTYDLKPEMSAREVTDKLITTLKKNIYSFLVVNFANPDMVGHTGNLLATIKAINTVDRCLGDLLAEVLNRDGLAVIIGDHGNAEQMVNPHTGQSDTEHTTNPAPFIIFGNEPKYKDIQFANGYLASVGPTILDLLGMSKDQAMTANSLKI